MQNSPLQLDLPILVSPQTCTSSAFTPPSLHWQRLSLPFSKDTVHSAWSTYTKHKHQHTEFHRLEYLAWRVWFSMHRRSKSIHTLKRSPRYTTNMQQFFQPNNGMNVYCLSRGSSTFTRNRSKQISTGFYLGGEI